MSGLNKRKTNTGMHQVWVCLCLKVETDNKIHLHIGAEMSSQERTRAEVGKEVRETY